MQEAASGEEKQGVRVKVWGCVGVVGMWARVLEGVLQEDGWSVLRWCCSDRVGATKMAEGAWEFEDARMKEVSIVLGKRTRV